DREHHVERDGDIRAITMMTRSWLVRAGAVVALTVIALFMWRAGLIRPARHVAEPPAPRPRAEAVARIESKSAPMEPSPPGAMISAPQPPAVSSEGAFMARMQQTRA